MADGKETVPQSGRRITMTDVARLAGCSQATVSFVLNEAPGVKISDEMRARVIEAARSLNYASSTFAHLRAQTAARKPERDDMIGFVVDQLATSPEAVVAIEGARQATWDDGRIVMVTQTMNDSEMEQKTIEALARKGIGGLIYMTIFTRKIDPPPALCALNIPVVLLNCYTEDGRFPAVVPSEVQGGAKATQALVDAGHRRIAIIAGEPWMEATRDRLRGYQHVLKAAGIQYDPELVERGNWSPSAGYEATRRLMALPNRPTAIFCQNDRMAIGCYEALKEAGLRTPEDISVVGYDDEEISRHLSPQLTTVVLPHRMMGHWAVEALAEASVQGRHFPVRKVEGALIERASIAPPRLP
jgi:LacI family transcriptional regulator